MAVSLHGNNGLITTNGTAAAPSLAAPDNDTGFFFGTNLIKATTSGTERLSIKADGNIEVATTTTTSPAYLRFNSNRSNADDGLGGITGVWNGNSVAAINFKAGADTTNKDDGELQFVTYAGGTAGERLRITSAGKVGINEDNPIGDLHVTTAGSSQEDGVLFVGGSSAAVGLKIQYDQSSNTVAKI